MFFQRYYLECLSHASYMIADEHTKEAVVIDPQRDVGIYADDAQQHGFAIKHVILTHFHADFIAGHIELRDKFGAQIYLGRRADAEFDFRGLGDGDAIQMGDIRLEVLETPGHTPEGLSIVVYDMSDGAKPYAVLTGDTLFLGDVGRPDLLASVGVTADELARMLYDSLHNKLLKLPDETLVYPAHGAGSMCGKQLSDEAVTTLGEQRRYNYALQPMDEENFVELVTADLPEAPAYFVHDATLNRKERPNLDQSISKTLKALELEEVLDLQATGAQIVDVRDAVEFAGAHLKGSLNIGIDGKYATWAGSVLKKDRPIVIVADPDRVEEAIVRLGRIGFDHVEGYLKNGMNALRDRPELTAHTKRISVRALDELNGDTTIIDIRTPKEFAGGHIEGSINIPLSHLEERLDTVPNDGNVIIHCQGGYRSAIATSLLVRAGHDNVMDLVGGYQAWAATKRTTN